MGAAIVFAVAAIVVSFAIVAVSSQHVDPYRVRPLADSSPVDHAERILASRYARGLINAEEYERMLVILRR